MLDQFAASRVRAEDLFGVGQGTASNNLDLFFSLHLNLCYAIPVTGRRAAIFGAHLRVFVIITLVGVNIAVELNLNGSVFLGFVRRLLCMYFGIVTDAYFFLRYVAARRLGYVILRVANARCRAGQRALRFVVNGLRTQALIINVIVLRKGTRDAGAFCGANRFLVGDLRLFHALVGESGGRLCEDRLKEGRRAIIVEVDRSRHARWPNKGAP